MNSSDRQQIIGISQQLEELWGALDALFADMTAEDWNQKHGPDWIFSDLPYHLGYMDHDVLARPMALGQDMPESEQLALASFDEIDEWNDSKFAGRPSNQTVSESLDQMRASRQLMRDQLAKMTDADMENPAWFALVGDRGFRPSMYHLFFCLEHTWEHFAEARLWRGVTESPLSTETLNAMLNEAILIFGLFFNPKQATEAGFSFGIEIPERGGGSWRFEAKDGEWEIGDGPLDDVNLVLTCTVNGYIKLHCHMFEVEDLLASGEVKASDMEALETMGGFGTTGDYAFPVNP